MWTTTKVLIYALVLTAVVQDVLAANQTDAMAKSDDVGMARRRNKLGYSALFPFLGIGGLHALSALVAIKFKIVLIFIAVIASVVYGYKLFGGSGIGCASPVYHESSGPIIPFEGYSSHISHSAPSSYSGYPGADPYSAYTQDSAPPSGADVASSIPYRRVSKQRSLDSSTPRQKPSFDLSELAFAVLGVQKMECRKRFLCEMRVNYNSNPIIGTAYNMISRQVFADYQSEIDEKQPKSMKHCYELYKSCRGPNDPTPEQEDNELEETSTQKDENSAESARSVPVRNSIPVPSLILARTKTE